MCAEGGIPSELPLLCFRMAAAAIPIHAPEELREAADRLDHEIDTLKVRIDYARQEAAKLRATADSVEAGTRVTVKEDVRLAKARKDRLLASSGVAVEGLTAGFLPRDLAAKLGIADERRARGLLLALLEVGKVMRYGDGWKTVDADENLLRDYLLQHKTITLSRAAEHLGLHTDIIDAYADRFVERGMAMWLSETELAYVNVSNPGAFSKPTRRPPENDPPAFTEAPSRGMPIRIVLHGKRAKQASVPGQGHKLRMRDKRYMEMQAATAERAQVQARKVAEEKAKPKGKKAGRQRK